MDERHRGHTRRQIIAALAGMGAWGVFWGGWGALLPAIKVATGASDAVFGAVLFGVAAGALPAMLLFGPLVDRFGPWALMASLGLFGASIIPIAFANSPLSLALCLVGLGATSSAVDIALNARVAALEAATGRRLFNMAHAVFPLAVVLASPAVGLARQLGVGTTPILTALAAASLLAALSNTRDSLGVPVAAATKRPKFRPSRALLIAGAVAAGIHVIENAVEQWSAIFLEQDLGTQPAVASLGPATYMGMLFLGRVVAQKYGERLGDQRLLVITGLTAAAGMTLAATSSDPARALLGFGIAGFGMAAGIPTLFSLTARTVAPDARGTAIGTLTALAYTGYLFSPPLIGGIAERLSLRASWATLAGVSLLLLVLTRGTTFRPKEPPP
ncbi:MFS transporter [Archangium sp.]|uniref:MFS transporter n=1 Tax=Archangium sp. TaxID=1872627 RepID=UPI002D715284|nr:MFS transporter [Archangium sp.]HYO53913.1 MFS transporter [Archangium sp.]